MGSSVISKLRASLEDTRLLGLGCILMCGILVHQGNVIACCWLRVCYNCKSLPHIAISVVVRYKILCTNKALLNTNARCNSENTINEKLKRMRNIGWSGSLQRFLRCTNGVCPGRIESSHENFHWLNFKVRDASLLITCVQGALN